MSSILQELLKSEINEFGSNHVSLEEILCADEYIEFIETDNELFLLEESVESLNPIINAIINLIDIDISTENLVLEKSLDILFTDLGFEKAISKTSDETGIAVRTGKTIEGEVVRDDEKKASFINKVWTAIKKVMVAIADKIASFYRAIFDNTKKISENCDKLLGVVDELVKSSAKASKKEVDLNLSNLVSKGQNFKDVNGNLSNLLRELQVFVHEAKVIKMVEDVLKTTTSIKATIKDLDRVILSVSTFMEDYSKLISTRGDNNYPKKYKAFRDAGLKVNKSALLPGNKALYVAELDEPDRVTATWEIGGSRLLSMLSNISSMYGMSYYKEKDDLSGRVSEPVMPLNTLQTIVNNAKNIAKLVSNYQKKYDDVKKLKRALMKEGDDSAKQLKESDKNIPRDVMRVYLNLFRWLGNQVDHPANELNSLSIKVCRGLLVAVGDTVKVYK